MELTDLPEIEPPKAPEKQPEQEKPRATADYDEYITEVKKYFKFILDDKNISNLLKEKKKEYAERKKENPTISIPDDQAIIRNYIDARKKELIKNGGEEMLIDYIIQDAKPKDEIKIGKRMVSLNIFIVTSIIEFLFFVIILIINSLLKKG